MFYLALLFCLKGSEIACKPIVYPSLPRMGLSACLAAGKSLGTKRLQDEPELRGYELSHVICEPENFRLYRRA